MTAAESTPKTLLIVDDEPEIREILKEVLHGVATVIRTAADGKEALQFVREGGIDAIVSDINMPVMNGLRFLAEVRNLCLETPFVIISAYGDRDNLREALRLDATDFIDKPFEFEIVRKVVSQALEVGIALRRVQEELEKVFANSTLPGDELIRARNMRTSVMMLKAKSSIYFQKKSG